MVTPDQTFGGLVVDSSLPHLPMTPFAVVGDRFVRYCKRYRAVAPVPALGLDRSGGVANVGLARAVILTGTLAAIEDVRRDDGSGLLLGQLSPPSIVYATRGELLAASEELVETSESADSESESETLAGAAWVEDGIVELSLWALKAEFPASPAWDEHLHLLVLALREAEKGPCVSMALLASAVAYSLNVQCPSTIAAFFRTLSCLEKRAVLDVLVALQCARRTQADVFVRAGDARRAAGTRLVNVDLEYLSADASAFQDAVKTRLTNHDALYVEAIRVPTNLNSTVLVFETTGTDSPASCHPDGGDPVSDAFATDGYLYDMGDCTLVVPVWTACRSVTGMPPMALRLVVSHHGDGAVDLLHRSGGAGGGGHGGRESVLPEVSTPCAEDDVALRVATTITATSAVSSRLSCTISPSLNLNLFCLLSLTDGLSVCVCCCCAAVDVLLCCCAVVLLCCCAVVLLCCCLLSVCVL